jgi:hypothetical protein
LPINGTRASLHGELELLVEAPLFSDR